jgi:cellulose biosynthesis protein BcsQ
VKVFATYNIKGGVGKTASTVNLAYLSAHEGARTLVWDLDPQGAATFYFRVKPKIKGGGEKLILGKRKLDPRIRGTDYEGLDLLPADFSYRHLDLFLDAAKKPKKRLRRLLKPFAEDYDHVFLDCAPSISLVSESIFVAADCLLVPAIPTTLSLMTLDRLAKHLRRNGLDNLLVLPFFCMADMRKSMHREICLRPNDGPYRFLQARIPYSSYVERMGLHRAPLATFAGWSAPARAYEELWREIKVGVYGEMPQAFPVTPSWSR